MCLAIWDLSKLTKNNALPEVILTFFNEANEIKSENASHI